MTLQCRKSFIIQYYSDIKCVFKIKALLSYRVTGGLRTNKYCVDNCSCLTLETESTLMYVIKAFQTIDVYFRSNRPPYEGYHEVRQREQNSDISL